MIDETAQTNNEAPTSEARPSIGDILDNARGTTPPVEDARPGNVSTEPEGERPITGQGPMPDWAVRAVTSERKKRQDLQRRLNEAEQERNELLSQPRQQEPEGGHDFWADPIAHMRQVQINANTRASKAEVIAEHGRAAFAEMDAELGRAIAAGDPEIPILQQKLLASDDPAGLAMEWYQSRRGPQRASAPVMPSNLAGARNVGTRRGPVWPGPTPINEIFAQRDIFKR